MAPILQSLSRLHTYIKLGRRRSESIYWLCQRRIWGIPTLKLMLASEPGSKLLGSLKYLLTLTDLF